jgi:hypothetical protein
MADLTLQSFPRDVLHFNKALVVSDYNRMYLDEPRALMIDNLPLQLDTAQLSRGILALQQGRVVNLECELPPGVLNNINRRRATGSKRAQNLATITHIVLGKRLQPRQQVFVHA